MGQNAKYSPRVDVFCFASINRHPAVGPAGPFGAKNRLMHSSETALLFDHFVGGKVRLSGLLRSGWEHTYRRLSPSSFFAK
jgi:hypothetical protein